jgi:hypothetical protein
MPRQRRDRQAARSGDRREAFQIDFPADDRHAVREPPGVRNLGTELTDAADDGAPV